MNTVIDYLKLNSIKRKDKILFLENKDNYITYDHFNKETLKISSEIINKYNLSNKGIAIYIDKSIDALKSMFAVLRSGNFYTVIDTSSPRNRIDSIINTLSPELIITNTKNINKLKELNYNIKVLNIDEIKDNNYKIKERDLIDSNPAYVLFTSGSTGIPKGTVITHKSLISYINWFIKAFNINSRTIFGSQTPFYFSMSVSDIFSTIITGGTFCLIPKINFSFPVNLIKYLNVYKINTIYWVPSALSIVANLKTFDYIKPKYLKKVLFAGEVMPMPQLNIWRKNLPNVMYANLFGPTETVDICTYYIVNREFKNNMTLPIGIPCENTEILLINENNKLCNKDEIGEIYVKGSIVGSGYYKNEEKTKEVFVQNPLHNNYNDILYKTGDLAKYNKYNELEYLGRKDFQIKHMGYRIELGEIETNINSLDGIILCACIYMNDLIILYYESNTLKEEDVINYANKKLVSYMRPNKVIKLPRMPYNANGKIDRVKLKEMYKEME